MPTTTTVSSDTKPLPLRHRAAARREHEAQIARLAAGPAHHTEGGVWALFEGWRLYLQHRYQ